MTVIETIENPFKPKAARIVRHYDLIHDHRFFQIRHIDMKKAMSFSYNPGQFIMLSIPGVGESPFSISSTPSRPGILEFGVRKVGILTDALFQKKDNEEIYLTLQSEISGLTKKIKKIEGHILQLIKSEITLLHLYHLIKSVKGVGFILATNFLVITNCFQILKPADSFHVIAE